MGHDITVHFSETEWEMIQVAAPDSPIADWGEREFIRANAVRAATPSEVSVNPQWDKDYVSLEFYLPRPLSDRLSRRMRTDGFQLADEWLESLLDRTEQSAPSEPHPIETALAESGVTLIIVSDPNQVVIKNNRLGGH